MLSCWESSKSDWVIGKFKFGNFKIFLRLACKLPNCPITNYQICSGFLHFSAAQAGSADADALGGAFDLRVHRAEIDLPPPLGHVVGVADVISKLRPLAADFAYLCHDCSAWESELICKIQILPDFGDFCQSQHRSGFERRLPRIRPRNRYWMLTKCLFPRLSPCNRAAKHARTRRGQQRCRPMHGLYNFRLAIVLTRPTNMRDRRRVQLTAPPPKQNRAVERGNFRRATTC